MARKSTTQQEPLGCPRTAQSSGMNNLPSEAGKVAHPPLEAPEGASAGEGQGACLKQEASRGFVPIRDSETARERGRLGGLASVAARRKRKAMREYMEIALKLTDEATGETNAQAMALAMVEKAKGGDVKAYEAVLGTVGEKAAQLVDVRSGDGSMSPGRDLTALPIDQLMALARAEWGEEAETAPAVEARP